MIKQQRWQKNDMGRLDSGGQTKSPPATSGLWATPSPHPSGSVATPLRGMSELVQKRLIPLKYHSQCPLSFFRPLSLSRTRRKRRPQGHNKNKTRQYQAKQTHPLATSPPQHGGRAAVLAETEPLRLLYGDVEPVSQLGFRGVRRQQEVVEARVGGREPVRVAPILADHQRLSRTSAFVRTREMCVGGAPKRKRERRTRRQQNSAPPDFFRGHEKKNTHTQKQMALAHQRARAQTLNRCSITAGGKLEQLSLRFL